MAIEEGITKAEEGKYGFHYFDKPGQVIKEVDQDQEEDESLSDDLISCENDCCDLDCECDDCSRCSNYGNQTTDVSSTFYAAA